MMDENARATYLNILAEIKHRIRTVDDVLDGKLAMPAKIAEELCLLQFRMVAELIAIGCLVLHQDLTLSGENVMAKAWNAGQIFKRLARLHSDFYPKPLEPVDVVGDKFKWVDLTAPHMTKEELIKIYDQELGAGLHRGSFRRIFRHDPPLDFSKLKVWRNKVVNLLNRHTVVSLDGENICHFNMAPIGEHPTCSLFRLMEG
jgi:hypothetical protein